MIYFTSKLSFIQTAELITTKLVGSYEKVVDGSVEAKNKPPFLTDKSKYQLDRSNDRWLHNYYNSNKIYTYGERYIREENALQDKFESLLEKEISDETIKVISLEEAEKLLFNEES